MSRDSYVSKLPSYALNSQGSIQGRDMILCPPDTFRCTHSFTSYGNNLPKREADEQPASCEMCVIQARCIGPYTLSLRGA
jgi:hypothetical protein